MRLVLHDLEANDYHAMFPDHNDDTRVMEEYAAARAVTAAGPEHPLSSSLLCDKKW
ncbi:hypothetical protein [Lachnotalea sp. AF33-28]|uniref:hypothetical protein n=1 Tax=Lachnotalea sp. AF33-28 TaxID=2292046 RepID=UPI001FA9AF3E|nr:hypothetical protein [Lachnotalea sp. AF33-28]